MTERRDEEIRRQRVLYRRQSPRQRLPTRATGHVVSTRALTGSDVTHRVTRPADVTVARQTAVGVVGRQIVIARLRHTSSIIIIITIITVIENFRGLTDSFAARRR